MEPSNESTNQNNPQAQRDNKHLERQLQELERKIIELRLEVPINNYEANDISQDLLQLTLSVLGDALISLGESLQTEFEIPEPPCMSVILRGLASATKVLTHLQEHTPYGRYDDLARQTQFLVCLIPKDDSDPDSD